MKFKLKKLGLLPRIIIAIVLGIIIGNYLPEGVTRVFVTFNTLFSSYLKFLIPLIIIGLVMPAIADIGKSAGRMLGITAGISYAHTVFAGLLAYFTGLLFFPSLISTNTNLHSATVIDLESYFTIDIPPVMDVMSALVLAFVLGMGMCHIKGDSMKQVAIDLRDIIERAIKYTIVPLLPIYIFGVFLEMSTTGAAWTIVNLFIKIIGVVFAAHFLLLFMDFCTAGAIVRRNPFKLIRNMLPAYFTALGTSSSAATIPVTLECTKRNGVSDSVASFVIPLCATIHLSGSELKMVFYSLALMMMMGMPHDFVTVLPFILMMGVVAVASPGVPGGVVMASLGLLSSMLGFNDQVQALMISLYLATDSFGTACNVTGDGAIALVMDKINAK